jgi:hypothetical protein
MKTTVRARAAGSRRRAREFNLRYLDPALRTMQFTPAEVRRIEKAATVSGYPGDGASWGRNMLLHDVGVILRSGAKAPAETI